MNETKTHGEWNDPANIGPKLVDFSKMRPRAAKPPERESVPSAGDVSDAAQVEWDSESRASAYSTVADPSGDDFCESCESPVVYSGPDDKSGTCRCPGGAP